MLRIALTSLLFISLAVNATVLPEERADLMFHSYDGGGVTIDGPSLLVRKNFADKVSISGNYYVDSISSASIDVEASGASRYSEERTEYSLSATYIEEGSLISAGLTTSDESDYTAETAFFSISQDFFGDLTSVTLGYARGNDVVMQNGNDSFEETIDRQNYRLSLSQIISPTLIAQINYEAITEEGFLNNPYRSYRYRDAFGGYQTEQEVYPNTRTSDALSLGLMYYLPYRASIKGEYRYYTDDWDIDAGSFKLSYTHPLASNWILDISLRHHTQEAAKFYNDLFDFASLDDRDYRARDKELSTFTSNTLGIGVSYQLPSWNWSKRFLDKSSVNFQWDHIQFEYDDFRDITVTGYAVGEEPLYEFDANVVKIFFSAWY
jgi:hypothetical protein